MSERTVRTQRAPLVEPVDDVVKHELDVVVWLASCQAMPHARVELELLVTTLGSSEELTADVRVRHAILFTVQQQKW